MKQTLLLIVLALGMLSINGLAQTKKRAIVRKTSNTHNVSSANSTSKETQNEIRSSIAKERKVGGNDDIYGHDNDGYIWYLLKKDGLYGAQDIEGKEIIPIKYESVKYRCRDSGVHYFVVKNGDFMGIYTREGTLVFSTEEHYTKIFLCSSEGKICWKCVKNGGKEIWKDAKEQEIRLPSDIKFEFRGNCFYTWNERVKEYNIYDFDGNKWCNEGGYIDENGDLHYKQNGNWHTKKYNHGGYQYSFEPYDDLYYVFKNESPKIYSTSSNSSDNNSASSSSTHDNPIYSSSSSSSSSNSSSNSGSGTTTIVVEHHRDPMPVQEWRACWACGGMGTMGCDNCGGSGTVYIGDRLHRCSRCNTRGVIPCNICYGNKGQYITVYR